MLIRELSERTNIPPRLLRYYEEQGLLRPKRQANGYRDYDEASIDRVHQIRGLLDSGLTTDIIKDVLPCLASARELLAPRPDAAFVARIEQERDRMQERIACLSKNKAAIDEYLQAIRPLVTT